MWTCHNCGASIEDRHPLCGQCGEHGGSGAGEGGNAGKVNLIRREVWTFFVKGAGLYLLVSSFLLIPDLFASILTLQNMDGLTRVANQSSGAYNMILLPLLVKSLFYLGAGLYLILGSGPLLRVLTRTPKS